MARRHHYLPGIPGLRVDHRPRVEFYARHGLIEKAPNDEEQKAADQMFELLGYVVREEDYATGLRQQRALAAGARSHVLFGRNEGGGQRFHRWVEHLLGTSDAELASAFPGEIG